MAEEFWLSEEGILIRLHDLAHDVNWRIYNGALQMSYKEAGFKVLVWVSAVDPTTCKYCLSQNGREYRVGQFLPRIPHHINCRCAWDISID